MTPQLWVWLDFITVITLFVCFISYINIRLWFTKYNQKRKLKKELKKLRDGI